MTDFSGKYPKESYELVTQKYDAVHINRGQLKADNYVIISEISEQIVSQTQKWKTTRKGTRKSVKRTRTNRAPDSIERYPMVSE